MDIGDRPGDQTIENKLGGTLTLERGFQWTAVRSSYSAIGASRSAVPGVIAAASRAAP